MRKVQIVFIVAAAAIVGLSVIIALSFVVYHAVSGRPITVSGDERPYVVTTAFPVQFLVDAIGGTSVSSRMLVPPEMEPHEFDPTLQDVVAMRDADLLVTLGGGIDVWADDAVTYRTTHAGPANTIVGAEYLSEDELISGDPHYWLDPTLYAKLIDPVTEVLVRLVPEDADKMTRRALDLKASLVEVDEKYAAGLAICEKREIVTLHDAYEYLANRYTFTVYAVSGLSPEDEPSLAKITELTDLIREKNISVVFSEPFIDPAFIETLSQETGATIESLDPIETESQRSFDSGTGSYVQEMLSNLRKLQDAMVCQ
jgi:zinc transport system substrate-binding protein